MATRPVYDSLDETDREARKQVDAFARIQLHEDLQRDGKTLIAGGACMAWFFCGAVFAFSADAWMFGGMFTLAWVITALKTRSVYRRL